MSDAHSHDTEEAHDSGIRTPKQLIAVILAAIVVPVVVIILLTQFVALEPKESPGSQARSADALAQRLRPVGDVQVRDASEVLAPRTGEQVFEAQCITCHGNGLAGSPKFGDTAAWAPRIVKGFETLWNSALKGKGNMSPQGGGEFTDFEIGRAVVYMANKGGAHFAEPPAPAASAPASAAASAAASATEPASGAASSAP